MIRLWTALAILGWSTVAPAAVEVNQASLAELEALRGVGPGLSERILAARQTGAFTSWQDLVNRVGGIGTGSAARLSAQGLTVAGAAYTPVRRPKPSER